MMHSTAPLARSRARSPRCGPRSLCIRAARRPRRARCWTSSRPPPPRLPDAAAIDDGRHVLTYCRLLAEVDALVRPARRVRHRPRRPGRHPGPVGHRGPLRRDPRGAVRRRGLRAGRRRRPRRARRDGVRRGRGLRGDRRRRATVTLRPGRRRAGRAAAAAARDDAWIIFTSGSTGKPKGVAVTHRSAAAFVDAEARLFLPGPRRSARATGCSPACRSPSTPPARRCGWPGGTAPASCPPRGRWCDAAPTSAPGWWRGGSRWCRPCRRWPRCGPPRSCAASGC